MTRTNAMVKMTEEAVTKEMQVQAVWGDPRGLEIVVADELQIQYVGDRCYLTFGQIRLPNVGAGPEDDEGIIHPMARLMVTKKSLSKMLQALNRVKETTSANPPEVKQV